VPYLESTVAMRGPVIAAAVATARTRRATWRKRSLLMVGPAVVLALVLAWAVRAAGDEATRPAGRDQQVQPRDGQSPSDAASPTRGGAPSSATETAPPAGSAGRDGTSDTSAGPGKASGKAGGKGR
jgi:hypothetical protein